MSPTQSAKVLCDVHVVKMLLESVQLLCNAWHFSKSVNTWQFPLYKATHTKHVCSRWICSDVENYKWLLNHALALSEEYTKRYNKIHKSDKILKMLQNQGMPRITSSDTFVSASNKEKKTNKIQFATIDIPENVKNIMITNCLGLKQ